MNERHFIIKHDKVFFVDQLTKTYHKSIISMKSITNEIERGVLKDGKR